MSEGSRRRGGSERTPRGSSVSLQAQRVRRTEEAFRSLPSRYLGADPDFDATFQIRLGDVGRTWEVRAQGEHCHVRTSATREPDVVIGSDAATWVGLREGRLSGLDAFAQRRLYARGDLDLALGFEGLFHLPGDRPPLLQVTDVEIPGATIRSLVAGDGPEPVVCLHGLGSNKASFFETVSALTPDHTGPRDRPAGVRRLVEARARRLRRSVLRPRGAGLHGRLGASEQPTWWAIRWAAGSRWSWRSPTRTGPSP